MNAFIYIPNTVLFTDAKEIAKYLLFELPSAKMVLWQFSLKIGDLLKFAFLNVIDVILGKA